MGDSAVAIRGTVEKNKEKSKEALSELRAFVRSNQGKFLEDVDKVLQAVFNKEVFSGPYNTNLNLYEAFSSLIEFTGGIPQVSGDYISPVGLS